MYLERLAGVVAVSVLEAFHARARGAHPAVQTIGCGAALHATEALAVRRVRTARAVLVHLALHAALHLEVAVKAARAGLASRALAHDHGIGARACVAKQPQPS